MQLTIPIHRHHFEAILCGDKTIEYRDKSPYWYSRLAFRKYSTARIVNGRNTKSQWLTCQILDIIENDDCFEIHLGPISDFGNLDKISGIMIQNTVFFLPRYNPVPLHRRNTTSRGVGFSVSGTS